MQGVVIFVGYIIAKVLRGIVTNIVTSLKIQSLVGKAGISNQTQVANICGYISVSSRANHSDYHGLKRP